MVEGEDGAAVVEVLARHLDRESTVLELGMESGADMGLLANRFEVTGSDNSPVFVDRYLDRHPGADILLLDAVTMDAVT